MSRVRNHPGPEEGFFLLTNKFARDPRVTPRAARVYIYLRSHRDGWETNVRNIGKAVGMGKNTVAAALLDLEELGYVAREQQRDDHGRVTGMDYVTYSEPCPQNKDVDAVAVTQNRGYGDDQGKQREPAGGNRNPENGNPENGNPESGTYKKTILKEDQLEEHQQVNQPPLTPQGGTTGGELDVIESIPVPEKPTGRIKYPPEFNALWDAYPKRTGSKKRAYAQYQKAVKRVSYEELQTAIHALSVWVTRNRKDPKYVVDAERWFRDDRWDDELIDEQPRQNTARRTNTMEAWLGIPEGTLGGQVGFEGFDSLRDNTIDGQVIDQRELGR